MALSQEQQFSLLQGAPGLGELGGFIGDKSGLFEQTGGSVFDPAGLFTMGRTNPDFVAGFQQPFLQDLFSRGAMQQQGSQGQFNQLPGLAQQLGQAGGQFLGGLGQSAQGLGQFTGQGPVNQQIGALTNASQQFLDRNLNSIAGQSNLAGGFGGTRSQVASGAAIGEATTGLGLGIGDILGQDIHRRQQAQLQQGQLQGIGAQLPGQLFDLFNQGLLSQFGGLESLAGLIGPAIKLGGGGTEGGQGAGGILGAIF